MALQSPFFNSNKRDNDLRPGTPNAAALATATIAPAPTTPPPTPPAPPWPGARPS